MRPMLLKTSPAGAGHTASQAASVHWSCRMLAAVRALGCRAALAGSIVLATGCASVTTPPPPPPDGLFQDHRFTLHDVASEADQALALSEPMQAFLQGQRGLRYWADGRERALLRAMQVGGLLRLEYDAARTRNAASAFEARAGNCLSLVLMTAAFAKAMGIEIAYQEVASDDNWTRQDGLLVSALHVNLMLTPRMLSSVRSTANWRDPMLVDFLPPSDLQGRRMRPISETTVLAMYLNNRATEALVDGRADEAYSFIREALRRDPGLVQGYNTLGVIYRRHGESDSAVLAFEHALRLAPDNLNVLANLAQAARSVGQVARADALQQELVRRQPDPPFAFFDRGMTAYRAGQYTVARDWFLRELRRVPDYHEFHFWLAATEAQLGHLASAREHLTQAMDYSTTRDDRALYAAKLDRLRALH